MKNYFKIIGSRSQKAFLKRIDSKNKNKVLLWFLLNDINFDSLLNDQFQNQYSKKLGKA